MKVMVLGIRGIPDVQGGVETHAEQLYTRLARLGCDITILVRTPFVPRGRTNVGPIRLRRIWAPRRAGLEALVHSLLGVLYAAVKRPDVLHIHAVGPALVTPIARLARLRVVVTHHGQDYDREKWSGFAREVLRAGERLGMRYSNARIAISRGIAKLVLDKHGRECALIPNGVEVRKPSVGVEHLERLGLEPGRYFVLVSRVVPEKRQLDLIRAHALAGPAGWKLAIVGGLDDSPYSREVSAAAREAGAVLTGFQSGEALGQLYSHAGAFVLPSSHEGLPIALLEALSFGLPVLASDIPANLEVGLPEGSYFRLGDVPQLAGKLLELTQCPADEQERRARREWVARHYDWDDVADRTLAVYRQLLPVAGERLLSP